MSPPSKPTSVLLAADDHYSVLATVRGLRVAGYVPYLATHKPGTYAARSWATAGTVLVPDPTSDREGFLHELAAAAARFSVVAVLPTSEISFLALASSEIDFGGIALGVPTRESVEQVTENKDLLAELAAAAGLRTPPTKKVTRHDDSKSIGAFGFPAVIKPKPLYRRILDLDDTLSSPARYVCSAEQAEQALEDFPGGEGIVQPYVNGQLTSVSGVSWEGELVCAVHQASIRIWPVPAGVSSYAETVLPDAELEQGVAHLLRIIGWSGIFQVQFIRTPHGERYMIDLNPRVYGSLGLAVAAGLNLPEIWVDLLLGRQPKVGNYRVGTRYRQEEKDVRALAQMLVVGGERRDALWGLVPRRNTTHAIFSIHDPMPLLTSVANMAGRFRGRR